jgi:hypothetical protein
VQLERRLREISGVSGELPREAWSQRRDPKWSDEVLDGTGDNDQVQENRPAILIESQNHCILMSNPRLGGSEDARCGGGDGRDAGVKGRG